MPEHWSDCAVHNEPAFPAGPCNCGGFDPEAVPIVFDVQTGFDDDALRANVRHNTARLSLTKAYLYANGPSAAAAPKLHPSVALNGALGLFTDPFRPADYWVACDPQELVAGFLRPGHARAYMPATKCHPAVFDRLERTQQTVLPWHLDDCSADELSGVVKVPTAVSVTICTLGLLYGMGRRDITVYGWDCCYLDGRDHAIAQSHDHSNDIEVELADGTIFQTTKAWACEVDDAIKYLGMYPDLKLTIEGPGMVGAIMRHLGVPNLSL